MGNWKEIQQRKGGNDIAYFTGRPEEEKTVPSNQEIALETSKSPINRELNRTNLFFNVLRSLSPIETLEEAHANIGAHALETIPPRKDREEPTVPFTETATSQEIIVRKLAADYVRIQMTPANELLTESTYNTLQQRLAAIEQHILARHADQTELFTRVVYHIQDNFFKEINDGVDKSKLDRFTEEIRHILFNKKNGEPRKFTLGFVLGYVSSGKGTSLAANGLTAVETGTEGILGHSDKFGYGHWGSAMSPFDGLRNFGVYYPDALMVVSTGIELAEARSRLDAEGKEDEAVLLSGFPRTQGQIDAFLKGIDPKTISGKVFLTMREAIAFERTIFRMFEDVVINGKMRPDDIASIMTTTDVNVNLLLQDIENFAKLFRDKQFDGIAASDKTARKAALKQAKSLMIRQRVATYLERGFRLNPETARFFVDVAKKDSMFKLLAKAGIEMQEIDVSDLDFETQAQKVGEALGVVQKI